MGNKKVKIVSIALALAMLLALAPAAYCTKEMPAEKKTIIIIDSAGRQIEIPQPLERIVVIPRGGLEVIRLLGAMDRVVGVSSILANDPKYCPELQDKPDVGSSRNLSYEKIIELNPDVVIYYASPSYSNPNLEEKVAPAGIKVVAFDCFKPSTLVKEIRTIGLMLGREERAEEFISFLQGYLGTVEERIEKLKPHEKKRVFYESFVSAGSEGAYKTGGPGSGYHDMIVMAGGINIFADATGPYPMVSAEAVLVRNPQVVIRSDRTSKTLSEMEALRNKLISRPGWSDLDAVKNNEVYIISTVFITAGMRKPIAICYIAKWLYPELFTDMDVQAFQDKFLEYQAPGVLERAFVYPPDDGGKKHGGTS